MTRAGGDTETYRTNEAWWAALNAATARGTALEELRSVVRRGLERGLGVRQDVSADDLDLWTARAVERLLHEPEGVPEGVPLTTWAQALALRTALGDLSGRQWRDIELENVDLIADDVIQYLLGISAGVELDQLVAEGRAWDLLSEALHHELDDDERRMVALAYFSGAPLSVVAQRLGMERDVLYRRLHDLRLRLRAALSELGLVKGRLVDVLEAELGHECQPAEGSAATEGEEAR